MIKDNHKLIDTGPYRLVRHPIYAGLIIAMTGSSLTAGTIIAAFGIIHIIAAFIMKLSNEERLLSKNFGQQYLTLRNKVSYRLLPVIF